MRLPISRDDGGPFFCWVAIIPTLSVPIFTHPKPIADGEWQTSDPPIFNRIGPQRKRGLSRIKIRPDPARKDCPDVRMGVRIGLLGSGIHWDIAIEQ